ncbi:uncharacterized protein LOC120701873 [Panicum virgatum]|uniref:uncharacterized protein LOC120701873 n=1 Tax=Panicum virgatum TaxID=38727 RepID=UPI0019D685CD|nr:uncharacterized protein LOC120701873 [Panicum virgatum]
MAGSNDETVELGVTENEERRLCGMAGDDDEDDLREDHDALFGPGADDPINIDDDGPAVPACGGAPPPPDGNSAKRSRPSTSPVWDDFEKMFKTTADGKTVRVSRQTTTRDIQKYVTDCKAKLVETFEKRVLGLVLIDVSHNGQNIADRVASVLADYGLTDKVFAVTLDNASSNASAMLKLKPIISHYLGFDVTDEPEYASSYKSYCIATGVRPRKFQLDMEVRWNSTYLMLKHLFPHKSPFTTFIQAQYPRPEGRGRRRPPQPPPRRHPRPHHLPPPHQGRRPHPGALLPVARRLALRPAQPRPPRPPVAPLRRPARRRPHLPYPRLPPGYRRLSVGVAHLRRRPAVVDAWLRSPALDGLQELEFDIGGLYVLPANLPLQASALFRFSATLRVATIAKCRVPDPDDDAALFFPRLRQLGLEDVVISEGSLHGIIAGCPVLESLLITGWSRFRCVRINSTTLVSLGLRVHTGELIIEHAPLLERLLQLEFRIATHLSVISAPKLETVGCLCDLDFYSKLKSEAAELQELSAVSLVTVVGSVRSLAINIPFLSIDMFVDLMRCFPRLEKLYIQTRNVSGHNSLWHDDVIKSLDIRLKTVALRKYQGTTSQFNLATFFVLRAKMLELMIVEGRHCGTKKFIREHRRWLPLEERASRGAQFNFTSSRCDHFIPHISHVRDLSRTDIFKCDSDCTL